MCAMSAGTKTVYSASLLNEQSISIDMGGGKTLEIDFFCTEDGSPEVGVSVSDSSGTYQDIVAVRPNKKKTGMDMMVFSDAQSEDWTCKLDIPFSPEFEPSEV